MKYALQLAQPDTTFILIHIVESASAKFAGSETEDYETQKDREQLEQYAAWLQQKGYASICQLGFRNRNKAIAQIANDESADMIIVGSHGHRAFKDLLFGETINELRHLIDIPVFIAR
jgi:manganese transport protein